MSINAPRGTVREVSRTKGNHRLTLSSTGERNIGPPCKCMIAPAQVNIRLKKNHRCQHSQL